MVKLIIQKKNTGTAITKISVCSVKVLEFFLWGPIMILTVGILGFVGKGAASLVRQLGMETAGGFFLSYFFLLYLVLLVSIANGSPEVVLPGHWLVSSIWFFLHWAGCNWDLR
jgi:hypothetical protein